jgi:maleate cis-trans isomerase
MATKIGFVQAGHARGGLRGLDEAIPKEVQVEHVGMDVVMDFTIKSSYEANLPLQNQKARYLETVPKAVRDGGWEAVAVMGWPVQMMNPGIFEELQAALTVPVTMAAPASSTALKAYGARRILLMTPWDDSVDRLLRDWLGGVGIEAVSPTSKPYDCIADGLAAPPEQVVDLTRQAFREAGGIQAVYFQAPLASYPVLESMESEFGVPMITSNLAALWWVLSSLGQRHAIKGHGRLLSEWPNLPRD